MEKIEVSKLTLSEAKIELKRLSKLLEQYDNAYYQDDAPAVSDAQYDKVKNRALEIEKTFPQIFNQRGQTDLFSDSTRPQSDSDITPISKKIGAKAKRGFNKVELSVPMLSLGNLFTEEDLDAFITRIEKELGGKLGEKFKIITEPKIDGLSFAAFYENGKFIKASTRGDGKVGEDITENLATLKELPKEITSHPIPEKIEIRGEVYINRKEFFDLNKTQEEKGKKLFANPRNAAAGSLRQLDSNITASRPLRLFAYSWGDMDPIWNTQEDFLNQSHKWGFPVRSDIDLIKKCSSKKEILEYYYNIIETRTDIPFDIDGVVYKVNSLEQHKTLGFISRAPRWAIAHKFPSEKAKTIINDITVQVGRTGILTPVAELEPINIGGVIVSRATLHNQDEIDRKDIRIGDHVLIQRAGEVIPQVLEVDLKQRPKDSQPFKLPTTCPSCGHQVQRINDEVAIKCPNSLNCPAQVKEYLKYFISKDAFNIDGLGDKQIELFYDKGWIKTPFDIFTLEENYGSQIKKLEGFGDLSASNIFTSINEKRNISLERFIYALGISGVGKATGIMLANHFLSLEKLSTTTFTKLIELNGIGDVIAYAIIDFFKTNLDQINQLTSVIKIINPQVKEIDTEHPLHGKTIVFTGTLEQIGRTEAQNKAREFGAKPSSSVSAKTHIIVAGANAGSKLTKANDLNKDPDTNIEIISEEDFLNLTK